MAVTFGGVTYPEMADSITPANLRGLTWADAYLGYIDGRWPDYQQIAAQAGGKPVYGLTVAGNQTIGDGTDSEPGNASIAATVADTKAELARGVTRPVVYCPASWATAMVDAHTAAGVPRNAYRLLTAHYGGPTAVGAPAAGMHICGPATCGYGPGSDGTQWQSLTAYDRSILAPDFLDTPRHSGPAAAAAVPPPPPPTFSAPQPIPGQEPLMIVEFTATLGNDGTGYVPIQIPPGCTHIVAGSLDVLDATHFTPPAHDGDLGPLALGKSGVVCQPCVMATNLPPGWQHLRISGGIPNHLYTGRAILA